MNKEEKAVVEEHIMPYKDKIMSIAKRTDYVRDFLDIKYNDGRKKCVILSNFNYFKKAEYCKYYPLKEFLEKVEQ